MPAHNARTGARRAGSESIAAGAVAEIQRQRILAAMAAVSSEHGAATVTVAQVVARAGVSRRTFYELFADREECFMAAFEEAIARAEAAVLPAYRGEAGAVSAGVVSRTPQRGGRPQGQPPSRGAGRQAGWRERVRAGLAALLGFLDENPGPRALLVVESLGAGPRALERRARIVSALIAAVDEGRAEARGELPPLTAEGVVGAVFAIVHARTQAAIGSSVARPESRSDAPAPLTALLGELMGMIVLPYLGQAAARREVARPAPAVGSKAPAPGNPLEGLSMRLTYRTIRVLAAVAQHPGSSNRDIGAAAEMTDQGQISKLLARLEGLGLIHNVGEGHVKGAANAWRLTGRGEQVERALRG